MIRCTCGNPLVSREAICELCDVPMPQRVAPFEQTQAKPLVLRLTDEELEMLRDALLKHLCNVETLERNTVSGILDKLPWK